MPKKHKGFHEILTENRRLRKDNDELKQKVKEMQGPVPPAPRARKNAPAKSASVEPKALRDLAPIIEVSEAGKILENATTQTETIDLRHEGSPCPTCPPPFPSVADPIIKRFAVPESWFDMDELTPGMALEWTIKTSAEAIQVHARNKELKEDIQRLQNESDLTRQLNEENLRRIVQLAKQVDDQRKEVNELRAIMDKRSGKRKMSEASEGYAGPSGAQQPAAKRAKQGPENDLHSLTWIHHAQHHGPPPTLRGGNYVSGSYY